MSDIKQKILNDRIHNAPETPRVSVIELQGLLLKAASNNHCIVSLSLVAEDTGIKKSCPIPVAAKVSAITGFIQRKPGMYERSVENQQFREGQEPDALACQGHGRHDV